MNRKATKHLEIGSIDYCDKSDNILRGEIISIEIKIDKFKTTIIYEVKSQDGKIIFINDYNLREMNVTTIKDLKAEDLKLYEGYYIVHPILPVKEGDKVLHYSSGKQTWIDVDKSDIGLNASKAGKFISRKLQ